MNLFRSLQGVAKINLNTVLDQDILCMDLIFKSKFLCSIDEFHCTKFTIGFIQGFFLWGTTGKSRVSTATTLLQPQPQQKAFILWNNPTDCTLSQLKCAELCRLACPRSHPDSPNHCLTTCGTNFWTANKPYFTPAPHQHDHFYLWFHTFKKRAISANLQLQQMQLEGYNTGQNIF